MLRMFPDLRTCCYCFCFRWSVLRRRPGDCRWHSPSSSTWSRIIQKKKFIKEIISEEQISSEWRIEIDFSSIHRSWVQLESIHPLLVKTNFWIEKKTENILCLSEFNVCDTDWRKSPWQLCALLYSVHKEDLSDIQVYTSERNEVRQAFVSLVLTKLILLLLLCFVKPDHPKDLFPYVSTHESLSNLSCV